MHGKAPLRVAQLCLPHLERFGQGRIVIVASLSGKRVRNDKVLTTVSTFAVLALTHDLRRIGWESAVRAVAIRPSCVRTEMTADATAIAPKRMIDPVDLADLVATVIAPPNTASVAELLVNCRLEDMVSNPRSACAASDHSMPTAQHVTGRQDGWVDGRVWRWPSRSFPGLARGRAADRAADRQCCRRCRRAHVCGR